MNTLSIDPGVTCCGWALWKGNELFECGLSRTKAKTIEERVQDQKFRWHWRIEIDKLVIEKPEIYQQRFWKGDPRDLIDLAMVVGGIIGANSFFADVKTVFPKQWKKQVPKHITEKRVLEKLSPKEKGILATPEVIGEPHTAPPSLRHNLIDAVGIGLWSLKR